MRSPGEEKLVGYHLWSTWRIIRPHRLQACLRLPVVGEPCAAEKRNGLEALGTSNALHHNVGLIILISFLFVIGSAAGSASMT
jgi:hypothetical protein